MNARPRMAATWRTIVNKKRNSKRIGNSMRTQSLLMRTTTTRRSLKLSRRLTKLSLGKKIAVKTGREPSRPNDKKHTGTTTTDN